MVLGSSWTPKSKAVQGPYMDGVVFAQNLLRSQAYLNSSPNGSCICTGQGIMTKKTLYIFSADNFFLSIIYPQLVGCTAVEASDMEVSPQCLNTLHL